MFQEVSIIAQSSPNIVLASSSKYRQQQLETLGLTVNTCPHRYDEEDLKHLSLSPHDLATQLATKKAQSIKNSFPSSIILGADQVAWCEHKILSKPYTRDKAITQLLYMQGKKHSLFSAFTIIYHEQLISVCDKTDLYMRQLTPKQIERYLDRDMPYDCAGSYKIEGQGITLFERIETTDFTAIIGLPLIKLTSALQQVGIILP